ncbi:MAG: phosphoserine phosphatase SerB [Pseudazoarcus pumilus]|nr:phosphoserine phosphatase SerB [Pseudazoarcus pumilus]
MNLVVQGAPLAPDTLEALRAAAGATAVAALGPQACRLDTAHHTLQLAALCRELGLDCSAMLERPLTSFGLFVTDMDSTLIDIECIDEVADLAGVKAEVSRITEAAMCGEIEFAESLTRRVALLAGLPERALHEVYDQRLHFNPGAEHLLATLRRAGLHTVLVSGGFTFFTDRLKQRLGFDAAHANALEVVDGALSGKLSGPIIDAPAKAAVLREARHRLRLEQNQTIAIGDGANDLLMLREAGLSIAYRAKPTLRSVADVCIDHAGLDGFLHLLD